MLLLQSGKSNTPPVAAFATPPAQVSVNQPIALDASGSTVAVGDALRYTWTVVGLEVTNYSIRPGNKNAEAVRAELRLFVPGTHTVTLSVFDGTNMSAPVSHTINVGQ
jgi:hypothetical protein